MTVTMSSPKPEAAGGGRTRGTMIAAFACLGVCSVFISGMQLKDVMGTETPKQQHFVVEQTRQSEQMGQCLGLDLDDGMDNLLDKYKQVFLVMPAKAAGTTYKDFTENCMKSAGTPKFTAHDNILNFNNQMRNAFKDQVELPSLVASHLYTAQPFQSLIKHATKDTLIIYSHREETSRFKSAVKWVIARLCENAKNEGIELLENECRVTESKLLEVVEKLQNEIGIGPKRLLSCKTFESIQENAPNLAFVNYKQANELQKLLSKHHCPKITDTFKSNAGDEKKPMSIVLEGSRVNGTIVSIDDWLKAKSGMLEYVFNARSDWSCQAKMKDIEEELFACPDEALQISGRSYENQKVTFPLL